MDDVGGARAIAPRGQSGCGAAAFAIRGRGRCGRCGRCGGCSPSASGSLGDAPAAGAAGHAALLLLGGFGRGVHQAEDLIERLARLRVTQLEPALAVVRAALPATPPVQALALIFVHAKIRHVPFPFRLFASIGALSAFRVSTPGTPQAPPSLFAAIIRVRAGSRKTGRAAMRAWRRRPGERPRQTRPYNRKAVPARLDTWLADSG